MRWSQRSSCQFTVIIALIFSFSIIGQAQNDSIPNYTIDATFDPNQQTIWGTEHVTYTNDSNDSLDAIFFLLLPNYEREANPYLDSSYLDGTYPNGFDPSWTRIDAVWDGEGEPLAYDLLDGPANFQTFSLREVVLKINLSQPLQPGQSTDVSLEFVTRFPETTRGDEGYFRNVYTWRFGWNPIAVPSADLENGEYLSEERAYYGRALPTGMYDLTLRMPREYEAAIGADQIEVFSESKSNKTIHATSDVPVRSVPISISDRYKVYQDFDEGIELLVYYLPHEDEQPATLIGSYALESLVAFGEKWGEYSHKRLVIAETPSAFAGFGGAAANGFILINQVYFAEKDLAVRGILNRLVDYLMAHEVAHMWWGVGIGVDWNAENFLSESFAQYFAIRYFEEKYGEFGPNVFELERDGLLESVVEHQFGYINLRQHMQGDLPYLDSFVNRFDEALVKPQENVEFSHASGTRIYSKGFLMLRALEGIIGQDSMDVFLRTSHERFLHKLATVEDIRAVAEEVSGQNLAEFFQYALFEDLNEEGRAPYADYGISDIETEPIENGLFENRVKLFREGGLNLPVALVARSADKEIQSGSWSLDDQLDDQFDWVFTSKEPLAEVTIDPESMIPDVNRLNNTFVVDGLSIFSRKLQLNSTGRNDLPLDAYTIRVDPFNQYIQGGYLFDHQWILGNGVAGVAKNLGRGSSINALAALTQSGVFGQFSFVKLFFTHPEIGFTGQFWEATDQVELSFLRRPDSTGRPILDKRSDATGDTVNVLGLTWVHQELVRTRLAAWVRVMGDPAAFIRGEIGGWRSFRLAPNIHLSGQVNAGWGEGTRGVFKFNLGELNGYSNASGYPYLGNLFMSGNISLHLPFQREMGYNLVNVAVLHAVDERLYFQFGNSWDSLEETQVGLLENIKSQIGFEITLSGRTFGGLLPWNVKVGMVYAISNIDSRERILKQYFEINTPFF